MLDSYAGINVELLAKKYAEKVKSTNALQDISDTASKGDKGDAQAGLMKNVLERMSGCISNLEEYSELWKKESEIRAAEAKGPIVVVNAASEKGEINCASGVMMPFEYARSLPRKGEAVETLEFQPREA